MRALAAIHIAGDTACSFGLVPLVSFSVASGPSEISSSLALRRVPDSLPACPGLYPFSPPPHLTTGPYWPSHPLLATTPLPPLPPSRFLSSGHPGTSVLSCPLPPSRFLSSGHPGTSVLSCPLPPSRFLSSGHPGTSVLSCPLPRLPACRLAGVNWCLNSSSLNCATSSETLE